MHGVLSECTDARWGEELPRESWSINNSLCVIHDLSLITRERDERGMRGGRDGGAESEIEGHRE